MKILMDQGIEKLYCGHYPYLKKPLHEDYIVKMIALATSIDNGTVQNPKPYSIKVPISCDNPMIAGDNDAAIVYDPEHIK
jgi:hydroxyacylglutathione hydrolase